jgi:hypothetical protein
LWLCNSTAEQGRRPENIATVKMDTVDFKTQVQPILEKNCSPCHFTGGKMYEKMPFDKGEIIIHHKAAIIKRIKDEKETNLIRQYTTQQKVLPSTVTVSQPAY